MVKQEAKLFTESRTWRRDRITGGKGDGLESQQAPFRCIEKHFKINTYLNRIKIQKSEPNIDKSSDLLLLFSVDFEKWCTPHGTRRGKKRVYFKLWPKNICRTERYWSPPNCSLILSVNCVATVTGQGSLGLEQETVIDDQTM